MPDQYSAASASNLSLTQKLTDLRSLLSTQKTVILVTHAPNGRLHGRVMAIAEITKDWKFFFIYDRESYKEQEVDNDFHVNISIDAMAYNKGWASIAGKAKRITSPEVIQRLYNPTVKAWFADKGDGVHDGSANDPRVAALEVSIDEVRHFYQEKTVIGTVIDVVASAVKGETATPGDIRQISGEEIASAWARGELKEP
ncbi:uncharacterized protein IAS62_006049 [Cryptococcus decagattii]|uniref:General stress protein FMN-binding split barrel domain-containing protein n=1 Tax=Cryptococcus decagattii TaxID=1859122 RepID=A0ABZ2B2P5_9TREE